MTSEFVGDDAVAAAAGHFVLTTPFAVKALPLFKRSGGNEAHGGWGEAAAEPVPATQLSGDGEVVLVADGDSFASVLAMVARDAIEVLGAGDGRLRLCADEVCSLVFYDESRPGQRRWCATARCGNRANTKAYRARKGTSQ